MEKTYIPDAEFMGMKCQMIIAKAWIMAGMVMITLIFLLPNSIFSYDLEAAKAKRRLEEFGYTVSGHCVWGEETQKALEQFQLVEGVKNIGTLNKATKKLLRIDSLRIRNNSFDWGKHGIRILSAGGSAYYDDSDNSWWGLYRMSKGLYGIKKVQVYRKEAFCDVGCLDYTASVKEVDGLLSLIKMEGLKEKSLLSAKVLGKKDDGEDVEWLDEPTGWLGVYNGWDKRSLEISFMGEKYFLKRKWINNFHDFQVYLQKDDISQEIISETDVRSGDLRLIWAGDFDGDNKLDLLLETNAVKHLFLSSFAKKKNLVEKVAQTFIPDCC